MRRRPASTDCAGRSPSGRPGRHRQRRPCCERRAEPEVRIDVLRVELHDQTVLAFCFGGLPRGDVEPPERSVHAGQSAIEFRSLRAGLLRSCDRRRDLEIYVALNAGFTQARVSLRVGRVDRYRLLESPGGAVERALVGHLPQLADALQIGLVGIPLRGLA